ncbi:1,4-dihydroxy-2-naphthoate octaprenyltransferase [Saccharomonospora amisosensis]|uniref:1,4-dihydroxy-2-naphthoate octaprenyltransferase n=1 Tax=Saccharomonospora amisosensis TaxID=1128677 RepID=A0A7X5ZTA3_9PSEU|nr:1,4-dihydroxy-2-naphthoate octaprenyltransferase [Saccharomonospora amisosensis]
MGSLSTAVLVANNLRDIPTDTRSGKHTLAVKLGDAGTRRLYLALVSVPFVATVALGVFHPLALAGVLAAALLVTPVRVVATGRTGMELIPVLRDTGLAMLVWSSVTAGALALS